MNPRFRLVASLVSAALTVALTISLGFWQLGRADEKVALQRSIDDQGAKIALTLAQLRIAPDPLSLVHQRVILKGRWAPAFTVFLDNRQMDARVGFFVVTPLLLEGGGAVLVQRGWVPRNFQNRMQLPPVVTPSDVVEIEGRIALPPSKLFEPGMAGSSTIRQNLDLEQFKIETGLPLMAITVLQTGAAGDGLRRDWLAVNLGVEKHHGYAFQWFALAALVAVLTLWFQIIRPLYQRSQERDRHA